MPQRTLAAPAVRTLVVMMPVEMTVVVRMLVAMRAVTKEKTTLGTIVTTLAIREAWAAWAALVVWTGVPSLALLVRCSAVEAAAVVAWGVSPVCSARLRQR